MLYWLGKITVICFLKLFFRVELQGSDVFPTTGPFILASNHPSYFDPPLLAAMVKRRIYFLAKEELFRNRCARIFFGQLGAIPLKRQTNDFRAMRLALGILKDKPLLMFPQGLVGAPWDQVNPGVGFLARKSGVPVIAARIEGSQQVRFTFKSLSARSQIRVALARVDTMEPGDSNRAIAAKVMDQIRSL